MTIPFRIPPATPKPIDNPLSWLVKHMPPAASDVTAAPRGLPPRLPASVLRPAGPLPVLDRGPDLPAGPSNELHPSRSPLALAQRLAELSGLPNVARAGYHSAQQMSEKRPLAAAGTAAAALLPFVTGPEAGAVEGALVAGAERGAPGIFARLAAKHPGLVVDGLEKPEHLVLSRIVVPEAQRGRGAGTAFMRDLLAEADAAGKPVALTPSSDFGGNVGRLKKFYGGLGFKPNTGRARDLSISEGMIRPPQSGF